MGYDSATPAAMSTTFIDDLYALFGPTTATPDGDALRTRLMEVLSEYGFSAMPDYFTDGIHQLAMGRATDWTAVSDDEVGLDWAIEMVARIVPNLEFRALPDRYAVVAPASGLAFIVESSGNRTRWSVQDEASVPAVRPAPAPGPKSFGTLSPSAEQLEQWARDPGQWLILEDEIVALLDCERHFALLVRLALDPETVKLPAILTALDDIVTRSLWQHGPEGVHRIDQALASLPPEATHVPDATGAWMAALRRLRAYVLERGPVSLEVAREIAEQLLEGWRRSPTEVSYIALGAWWQFSATVGNAPPYEYLYVHQATGALRFSQVALDLEQLGERRDLEPRLRSS